MHTLILGIVREMGTTIVIVISTEEWAQDTDKTEQDILTSFS
jgi:hypothetical protein